MLERSGRLVDRTSHFPTYSIHTDHQQAVKTTPQLRILLAGAAARPTLQIHDHFSSPFPSVSHVIRPENLNWKKLHECILDEMCTFDVTSRPDLRDWRAIDNCG